MGAKTQPSIAVSSCDSEYTACYDTAKEAIYMRLLLKELGFKNYQSAEADFNIQTDNQAAIGCGIRHHKTRTCEAHSSSHPIFARASEVQASVTYVRSI